MHLVGHPSEPNVVVVGYRNGDVREVQLSATGGMGTTSEPILRVSASQNSERGLLSVALHPDDAKRLFVFYTAQDGDSTVQEFKRNGPGMMATPVKMIYEGPHPSAIHQGGSIAFGQDKLLYVSIGDNQMDPNADGANTSVSTNPATAHGKLFRFDTSAAMPMREMVAYGLRNVWRMSFDRMTGDLYMADVGGQREEVNRLPKGVMNINYGWANGGEGMGAPIHTYNLPNPKAITGGYVYRGTKNACMYGRYFFADSSKAVMRSIRIQNGVKMGDEANHPGFGGGIYSFGEDGAGELYVLYNGGRIARVAEGTAQ